jgi:hypothetical protein
MDEEDWSDSESEGEGASASSGEEGRSPRRSAARSPRRSTAQPWDGSLGGSENKAAPRTFNDVAPWAARAPLGGGGGEARRARGSRASARRERRTHRALVREAAATAAAAAYAAARAPTLGASAFSAGRGEVPFPSPAPSGGGGGGGAILPPSSVLAQLSDLAAPHAHATALGAHAGGAPRFLLTRRDILRDGIGAHIFEMLLAAGAGGGLPGKA